MQSLGSRTRTISGNLVQRAHTSSDENSRTKLNIVADSTVDSPVGVELASINIDSAAGILTGAADLVYVPEPASVLILTLGALLVAIHFRGFA